jgi:hypothetical protein
MFSADADVVRSTLPPVQITGNFRVLALAKINSAAANDPLKFATPSLPLVRLRHLNDILGHLLLHICVNP